MVSRLKDKTIVVTGAGARWVRRSPPGVEEGAANLILTDLFVDTLADLADALRAKGVTVAVKRLDVADGDALIRTIVERLPPVWSSADSAISSAALRARP